MWLLILLGIVLLFAGACLPYLVNYLEDKKEHKKKSKTQPITLSEDETLVTQMNEDTSLGDYLFEHEEKRNVKLKQDIQDKQNEFYNKYGKTKDEVVDFIYKMLMKKAKEEINTKPERENYKNSMTYAMDNTYFSHVQSKYDNPKGWEYFYDTKYPKYTATENHKKYAWRVRISTTAVNEIIETYRTYIKDEFLNDSLSEKFKQNDMGLEFEGQYYIYIYFNSKVNNLDNEELARIDFLHSYDDIKKSLGKDIETEWKKSQKINAIYEEKHTHQENKEKQFQKECDEQYSKLQNNSIETIEDKLIKKLKVSLETHSCFDKDPQIEVLYKLYKTNIENSNSENERKINFLYNNYMKEYSAARCRDDAYYENKIKALERSE